MSLVIRPDWLLGLALLSSGIAAAEDPCASATEERTPSPALHLLQLGSSSAIGAAETRLQLELQLLLDGECLVPLHLNDPDFHGRSLSEQQARLDPELPDAAMVLWIDTSDAQTWRVMLLTGGSPRTVLRVVESPGSLEDIPDLAMAVAETLRRIQVSVEAPAEPEPEPEPVPEPEPEPEPDPEPEPTWALSLSSRLSQSLAVATGPGRIWGGGVDLEWSPTPRLWLSLGASALLGEEADRHLDRAGLELSIGRSLPQEWIRPTLGLELSGNQLSASGADGQPGMVRFANLEGRAGLDLVAPINGIWRPHFALSLGLSALDPQVKRSSDAQVLLAPGPIALHLSVGVRRER